MAGLDCDAIDTVNHGGRFAAGHCQCAYARRGGAYWPGGNAECAAYALSRTRLFTGPLVLSRLKRLEYGSN
jgi:hypothetical protein